MSFWRRYPHYSWIIWYAVILHFGWGSALIFLYHPPPQVVGMSTILSLCSNHVAAGAYLVASFLAGAELMYPHIFGDFNRRNGIILIMPQQFLLMISAGDAIAAAIQGHYADGYHAPWAFILVDQAPAIIAAGLHTLATIERVMLPEDQMLYPLDRPPRWGQE